MKTEPEILLHPNIPKPLHGLNPRSIMGQSWWDIERQKAYASTDYHCLACGVPKREAIIHRWLEAHEYYRFHYPKGLIEIERIIPLCHACHNYIHSGKLMRDVLKLAITRNDFWKIVKHGTEVLQNNNLQDNPFMINMLVGLRGSGIHFPKWAQDLTSKPYKMPIGGEDIPWEKWRLSFNGRLYEPIHKSYQDWVNFYK